MPICVSMKLQRKQIFTDVFKDGFVQYHCVNDDMGMIYQDFLQYLSEVKMLRNKYLTDIEE